MRVAPMPSPGWGRYLESVHDRLVDQAVHQLGLPRDMALEVVRRQTAELRGDEPGASQQVVLVAHTEDGVEAGSIWVGQDRQHPATGFIHDLFVAREHRRTGVGRRLVEAAHDWAVRAGLREMRMHVFGGDHAARSFYQSLGYSPGATQMHRSLPLADPVLRIVLARGSEGTGMEDLLEPAARRIAGLVPGPAPIESLDYPATATITSFDWPGWVRLGSSPREGIRALVTLLEDHAAQSPTVPVVLMGFSQGALVITEALTPPRRRHHGFAAPALSDRALGVVRAAVSVGNPSFRAGEPFNRGTPAPGVNGMRARTPGLLDHVADRVFDFAEHDDVSAQHLRTSTVEGHLAYGARGYVERIVEAVEPLLRTSAPERP